MAYAAASDVAILTRNLLGSASEYDTSTSPTLVSINTWLSSGCSVINTKIGQLGYGAIPTSSEAFGLAQAANANYGAWEAERSRTMAAIRADERTRADMFKRDFEFHLDMLCEMDLGSLGVSKTRRVVAGGIKVSTKDTREADTDRVTPRFTRGGFDNPDARDAGSKGAQSGDPQAHET